MFARLLFKFFVRVSCLQYKFWMAWTWMSNSLVDYVDSLNFVIDDIFISLIFIPSEYSERWFLKNFLKLLIYIIFIKGQRSEICQKKWCSILSFFLWVIQKALKLKPKAFHLETHIGLIPDWSKRDQNLNVSKYNDICTKVLLSRTTWKLILSKR